MKSDAANKAGPKKTRVAASSYWLARRDLNHRTHDERHASRREYRREKTLREWLEMGSSSAEFVGLRPPPRPLGEVLSEVMGSIGMRQAHNLVRLRDRWEEIVGADVAKQTRPCAVRNKVLFVEVASPTWLFVLKGEHRDRILKRLESCFPGEIRNLRFVPRGRFADEAAE